MYQYLPDVIKPQSSRNSQHKARDEQTIPTICQTKFPLSVEVSLVTWAHGLDP